MSDLTLFDLPDPVPLQPQPRAQERQRVAEVEPVAAASLFTPEQEAELERLEEEFKRKNAVHIRFTKAQSHGIWDMFAALCVWMVQPPARMRGAAYYPDALVEEKRMDHFIERFLVVRNWIKDMQCEENEAADHAELQTAYRRLIDKAKEIERRWTNLEVCLVFCELSMRAPLHPDAFEEYVRAFAHIFGFDTYVQIMHSGGTYGEYRPPLQGLSIDRIRQARWFKGFNTRLPLLDEHEIEWIRRFNERVRAYNAGETWPGTDLPTAVVD